MHRISVIPKGLQRRGQQRSGISSLLRRALSSSKFPSKEEIPNIPLDKPLDPGLAAMPQVISSKDRPKIGDCQVTTMSNGLRVASQVRVLRTSFRLLKLTLLPLSAASIRTVLHGGRLRGLGLPLRGGLPLRNLALPRETRLRGHGKILGPSGHPGRVSFHRNSHVKDV